MFFNRGQHVHNVNPVHSVGWVDAVIINGDNLTIFRFESKSYFVSFQRWLQKSDQIFLATGLTVAGQRDVFAVI
ncbi:MAG TPA: hypothetical protein DCS87_12575 [Rheinheimera sp.]|nr:hypothetical protein [Rheinheimera sp.]